MPSFSTFLPSVQKLHPVIIFASWIMVAITGVSIPIWTASDAMGKAAGNIFIDITVSNPSSREPLISQVILNCLILNTLAPYLFQPLGADMALTPSPATFIRSSSFFQHPSYRRSNPFKMSPGCPLNMTAV